MNLSAIWLDEHACPFCGSTDVEQGGEDLEADTFYQESSCGACGRSWRASYALFGATPVDTETGDEDDAILTVEGFMIANFNRLLKAAELSIDKWSPSVLEGLVDELRAVVKP